MKKNKLIGLFTVLTTMLVIYGCSDEFLIDEKTDGLSTNVVYAGEATAVATVTGIYDSFQAEYGNFEYNTKSIFILNHLTLDFGGSGSNEQFIDFELGAGNEITSKMWPTHYIGIGKANSVIFNLPQAIESGVLTPQLGNRLIGEALVLRSIFYYYLGATIGGVPLIVDAPSGDTDYFAPRSTQDEVFEQMVLDLETAIPSLPWDYNDIGEQGRVTKATAYAFLGSAHMWLGNYAEAVTAFEAIEGHVSLEENFGDIHAYANQNNKESLFEIQFNDLGNLSWDHNDAVTYLQSFCMPSELSNAGYGGQGTQALYDSFEAGDLRRPWTVIGPGEEHPDPLIDIINYTQSGGLNTAGTVAEPWLGGGQRTGYFGIKVWRDPVTTEWNGPSFYSGQNHIWLRYGEVLISLAEAAFKSGQQAKADAAIQQIRNRAWGGSAAPVSNVDMTDIMNEYRHEIGGEFSLWTCIRRADDPVLATAVFGINTTTPRGMLLPIPSTELQNNASLVQNPGY